MIKKLAALLLLSSAAHAFSPVRYVQISTNTLTKQSGAINISSASISSATFTLVNGSTVSVSSGSFTNLNATTAVLSSATLTNANIVTSFNAGANRLTNVSTPTAVGDAATKGYVDTLASASTNYIQNASLLQSATFYVSSGTVNTFRIGTSFDGGSNRLTSISTPTAVTDAATKGYVDTLASGSTNYIQNQSAVQLATFNVSSGTVAVMRTGSLVSSGTVTLGATTNGVTISTNVTFSPTTAGIKGTTTNDNAAVGIVGEYISSSFSGVSVVSNNTAADATSIALTAGDWDIAYAYQGNISNVANVTAFRIDVTATSGNNGGATTGLDTNYFEATSTFHQTAMTLPRFRVSPTSTTTYYAKIYATYSGTAPAFSGFISARRVR